MHAEAEPIHLGKDIFHLPTQWSSKYAPFASNNEATATLFSKTALSEIRNRSFVFSTDQVSSQDFTLLWKDYEEASGTGSFSNLTTAERCDIVTDLHHTQTTEDWDSIQLYLCKFRRQMEYVGVDFTTAYCTADCCRPLQDCTDRWITRLVPNSLNITGLMAAEQPSFDLDDFESGERYEMEDLKRLYNLRFVERGEETKWDVWKIEQKESTDKYDAGQRRE